MVPLCIGWLNSSQWWKLVVREWWHYLLSCIMFYVEDMVLHGKVEEFEADGQGVNLLIH
jgi:hypothetical protein